MYHLASNTWTWLSGSSLKDQPGAYGNKGEASFTNQPSARRKHSMILDTIGFSIFLFSGEATGNVPNDLWTFSLNMKQQRPSLKSVVTDSKTISRVSVTTDSQKPRPSDGKSNGNFWADNMSLSLTILASGIFLLFEVGFFAGFLYEGGKSYPIHQNSLVLHSVVSSQRRITSGHSKPSSQYRTKSDMSSPVKSEPRARRSSGADRRNHHEKYRKKSKA